MSSPSRWRIAASRPHLWLIALIGVIVPGRLRADWREEWEAELRHRERRLADWDRLDGREKWHLLRMSASAFWDALWLQRQRLEDDVVQDLRFGVRMLVKHPTFSAVAVLTLALGIGANTAVFAFVDALLLRPLEGVTRPGELVQLGRQYRDRAHPSDSSYPDYVDYRDQSTVLSGVAVTSPRAFHLSSGGQTERVVGELVSSNYFDVLGVTAERGRMMSAGDDRDTSADSGVVLSHRFWQRRFGGDASVLGTTIRLDGHDFSVIGVTQPRFEGLEVGAPRDVWVPLVALRRLDPAAAHFERRGASWLQMFGRLGPGVTLDRARAELSVIAQRLATSHPATNGRAGISVETGLGRDVETQRALQRFALLPLASVAIVLVIACANVAGLLLARGAARRKEIATRVALGARRARVIRQLLTESLVLSGAGGIVGLLIGMWLTRWLHRLLPDKYLFLSFDLELGLDWRVFVAMLSVAAATSVLVGVVPALQSSQPDIVPTLKETRGSGGPSTVTLRGLLVVGQLALSTVLLVTAGLCVRTLSNVAAIDTGYESKRVLTARLDLGKQRYDEPRRQQVQHALLQRVRALPGVQAAGFAVTLPLNDGRWEDAIRREGDPTRVQTYQNVVSPGYFEAIDIPLVAGRRFSEQDDGRAPRVAVVNQTLARILWPGESPIGRHVRADGESIAIIGVERDIKGRNLVEAPGPMLYLPLFQSHEANVVLHVRSAVPSLSLVPALRREVQAVDDDLPIYAIKTLDAHVQATMTPQRLLAYLITGFGGLAVLLAAIGLYGVLSYSVTQRSSEIGIRVALGARKTDVMRLVVSGGMRLALAGIVLGSVAACAVTPLMASLLFGVSPLDPFTLTLVLVLLLLVALAASALPARRAARADPGAVLRCE